MATILYRKNEDGEVEAVKCNPLSVAGMVGNGFVADPKDLEEKPKRAPRRKKADEDKD